MSSRVEQDQSHAPTPPRAGGRDAVFPQSFSAAAPAPATPGAASSVYLHHHPTRKLVEFFEAKGLDALKREDQHEHWYADWLAYQAQHQIYASVLSPRRFSTLGREFDLLRYARFLEVFAYFSPAHGYSVQVTFLGLFSILMGTNDELKREAVEAVEAGGLLAFGVSERSHGADLLANEFAIAERDAGRYVASGSKYYIGNTNVARIISILARDAGTPRDGRARRAVPVLFALRPGGSPSFRNLRKIRTHGVRAAHVGEFEVTQHELPHTDVIAKGRGAWDAVLGTVTLGKFFLGFGSIGICQHALREARDHLRARMLYGRPAIEMTHIRSMMAQAYARLLAMKLYAYRALDYARAAAADDRRYLLFCAVQKAKVSTEGVRVITSLSECAGAKAFEADTYLEMALRDAPLIPALEGSAHINLAMAAQFIPRYFGEPDGRLSQPASLVVDQPESLENPYLMEARSTGISTIAFPHFLSAYVPLLHVPNVRRFAKQARAFRRFLRGAAAPRLNLDDTEVALALGRCLATIAYAQLIAEHACRLGVEPQIISAVFHLIVADLGSAALALASLPQLETGDQALLCRMVVVPRTAPADWDAVRARMDGM